MGYQVFLLLALLPSIAARGLPSLSDLIGDGSGALIGNFQVSTGCTATAKKTHSLYQFSSTPEDCINLENLLQIILPSQEGNFDMGSGDFMVLNKIIIRSFSFDTSSRAVSIATAYNGSLDLVPNLISISDVRMGFSFSSTHPGSWRLDISASVTIGTVVMSVSILRNEEGYYLSAKSQFTIHANNISSMFDTSNSFLPDTDFNANLTAAKLDSFAISEPHVVAVFTSGYGFLFGGQVTILDWEPFYVALLVNKVNDQALAVTIALYVPSFTIAKVFNDLFSIDVSGVPLLGHAVIRNLGLLISTREVVTPLVAVDVGPPGLFTLPYRQGIALSFDVLVADVYVKMATVISTSEISLTVSQPGELTLGRVISSFLPDNNLISNHNTLIGWPSFIEFNPLSISLTLFDIAATKPAGSWTLTRLNVKLQLNDPIYFFNRKIAISDLKFELHYRKTSNQSNTTGVISGKVSIGDHTTMVSPSVDFRVPFPFANNDITFTFHDFSVHDIATAFNFHIPNDTFTDLLTQIQLDLIALRFNAAGKLNTIDVKSSIPGVWHLFGSFSIANVKLSFKVDNLASGTTSAGRHADEAGAGSTTATTRSSSSSGTQWVFEISGELRIGACTIFVTAELGSRFFINATGVNCAVSISDILTAIHVNPSILPSMITGFTISEPVFTFTLENNAKTIGFGATTSLFGSSDVEVALVSSNSKTAIVAAFAVTTASDVSAISFLSELGLSDIAVVFISQSTTLSPYKWGKPVFNNYVSTTTPVKSGLKIFAVFKPNNATFIGRLLLLAGHATIKVELDIPQLVLRAEVSPATPIPLGAHGRFIKMTLIISKTLIGLEVEFGLTVSPSVDLTFTGEVTFTFGGTVTISLLMKGVWANPFGISDRLTVFELGIAIGINVVTLLPSFGLTGSIMVEPLGQTPINSSLTICFDTSNPASTVLEIRFTRLLFVDIVNLFVSGNTPMTFPSDIANMGFPDEVWIYVSFAGNDNCFGKVYQAGVEIHGTFAIPFLQIRVRADISIGLSPFSLKADLRMDPINYGNGLIKIVSADSDSVGPFLKLNVGTGVSFLIDGSCKVVLFGASISIRLIINTTKLYFFGELNLWNLFRVSLEVDLEISGRPGLHVHGLMQNDLFQKIKERAIQGIRNGARAINQKISAAQRKIDNAQREVDKLLGSIRYHQRKIEEAKNDCRRAPWYKKYICIGTGFRIVYHGTIIAGLWIAHKVATGVLQVAKLFLEGVKGLIQVGAEVLSALVYAALSIIDIRKIEFDLRLQGPTRRFHFEADIRVFDRWTFKPSFTLDFSSSHSVNSGINDVGDTVSSGTVSKL